MWRELPPASRTVRSRTPPGRGCEQMRDFVTELRQQLTPKVKNLTAPGIQRRLPAACALEESPVRDEPDALRRRIARLEPVGLSTGTVSARAMAVPVGAGRRRAIRGRPMFAFCATFPDAFFVSERARVYLDPKKEKQNSGRLLSAGFHSMTGYFRDDGPLYELMLDEQGQRELDRLWQEFDFITAAPMRQYTSFVWFERTDSRFMRDPEFDFVRAEDKDAASEAKIKQLGRSLSGEGARRTERATMVLAAIEDHFQIISAISPGRAGAAGGGAAPRRGPPGVRRARLPPSFVEGRARRRRRVLSLAPHADGLSHEDAVRDTVVSVLMSPHFCYRVDLPGAGTGVQPLVGLRPGQPPELLPLVEHARRRTARPCRRR